MRFTWLGSARRRVAAVVPALVLGLGLVAVASGPAGAATSCSASYTTQSQWSGGFVANVTVTDTGIPALSGWTVTFTFGGDQKVTNSWNTSLTQSAESVTANNASYNGTVAAGSSTSFGFQGTYASSDAAPASLTCSPAGSGGGGGGGGGGSAPQLHVSGNKLVDASGNTVVLHGMNRSGTEFACVQNAGIWSGPNDQASITAIKTWTHVNAVRVPLNEACWNGKSYVPSADAGANYINAVKAYVSLLNSNGIVAILDLHWTDGAYTGPSSACSDANATCQKPMPDASQAVPFWTSVANTFKGNNAVIFDLFNEPYPDIALGSETAGWQCLRSGGSSCSSGFSYPVAGMQTLVNAVRSTGASNVIMVSGLTWTNDLTQWLAFEPADPDHNIAASWHSYNFNACVTQSCWTSQIAPVIAKVPLIAGEIGENDCAGSYIQPLTTWLNSQGTGYLAWTWDDWNVGCNPVLITDYTGTPTAYGAAYKAVLQALP
jgi:hypothetical protein